MMVRTSIIRWILSWLTRKRCPDIIPTSGERAEHVDCYITYITDASGTPHLLVDSVSRESVEGRVWNGSKFDENGAVPLTGIGPSDVKVERFLRSFQFRYNGLWPLLWRDFSRYSQFQVFWARAQRSLFRRKRLFRHARFTVLQKLVDDYVQGGAIRISVFTVLTGFHSPIWAIHPEQARLSRHYKLILDSFVASGELKMVASGDYEVTGQALSTLSDYEHAERRHKDQIRLARAQSFLTFALVVVAVFQLLLLFKS